MKKFLFLITIVFLLYVPSIAQTTYVPDDNFEQALIDLGLDSGALNDSVPTAAIDTLSEMNLISKSISDLTGIAGFAALKLLNCYGNQLTNIDVSTNTLLANLYVAKNQLTSIDFSKNTALQHLYCDRNQISNVDVSKNTKLTRLFCGENNLTQLDISSNPDITMLSCYTNQLTSIDVTKLPKLNKFDIYDNPITQIDISNNPLLIEFKAYKTQLASVDFSNNVNLTYISIYQSMLTDIDVSTCPNLQNLHCQDNSIISIDISNNPQMTYLYCEKNQLTELNLKNGNNAILYNMLTRFNPDLTCIDIDDLTAAEANPRWRKDITANYSENCGNFAIPITFVPDDNFEQALIDLGLDSGELNDSVPTNTIRSLTSLDVRQKNIADLTGIEDFAALKDLICYGNQLSSLDISKNVQLYYLSANANNITSLDLSSNTELGKLQLNQNQLTTINLENNTKLRELYIADNPVTALNLQNNTLLESLACDETNISELDVSTNTALKNLGCSDNGLTTLDISNNIALETLGCSKNQLTNLDLSKNTLLKKIYSDYTQISTLDLSTCVALEILQVIGNKLTSLNLDACPVLKELACFNNQIISLDLSTNSALTMLFCQSNNLSDLNVKNGNNSSLEQLNARANKNLYCIQVDDSLAATGYANWEINGDSEYSNNCSAYKVEMTYVPDDNFEQALIDLGYDSGSLNDSVPTRKIKQLTQLSVAGKNISDLTGIEDFKALTKLVCHSNPLINFDLSTNTLLEELLCANCQLTTLNVNANTALTMLSCSMNELTELNVAANTMLDWLNVQQNQITTIDLSTNAALKYLSCYQNNLCELNLSNNTLLEELYCGKNQLRELPGVLSYSQNQKSGLIDENSVLNKLHIKYNNFVFASLEDDWSQLIQLEELEYSPQAKVGTISDTTVVRNKPFTFTIENYIPGNNDQYKWYKGNKTIEGATNVTLKLDSVDYTDAGTYTCEITNTLISSLTLQSEPIKLTISTPVGISEIPELDINIYPNPATTKIYVEVGNKKVDIQIYNQTGKLILVKNNFTSDEINVSQLPKGMYFVKIAHQQKAATKKIILR